MRWFKLVVTLLVLGLIVLFVVQNMPSWTSPISLKLDLSFLGQTQVGFELYTIMLLSALAGFVVGAAAMLKPYMKARKTLALERREKKEGGEALSAERTAAKTP